MIIQIQPQFTNKYQCVAILNDFAWFFVRMPMHDSETRAWLYFYANDALMDILPLHWLGLYQQYGHTPLGMQIHFHLLDILLQHRKDLRQQHFINTSQNLQQKIYITSAYYIAIYLKFSHECTSPYF